MRRFVRLAGYVTRPFISPHGQLSAEGRMEVVSWGPLPADTVTTKLCVT